MPSDLPAAVKLDSSAAFANVSRWGRGSGIGPLVAPVAAPPSSHAGGTSWLPASETAKRTGRAVARVWPVRGRSRRSHRGRLGSLRDPSKQIIDRGGARTSPSLRYLFLDSSVGGSMQ